MGDKLKIFAIGYSDNTSTSYLLDYLTKHGVVIEGVVLPKNHAKRSWRRLAKTIQVRGFVPALRRIYENTIIRRRQITQICKNQVKEVFFVDDINSKETREVLISHGVELVLLTATPIIKPIIIDINDLTILNAHTGWLPKYRGLDANLKALRDSHEPGVSVHKVTEKLDAGEIYLREKFTINYDGDILRQLERKELELAGRLFVKAIGLIDMGKLRPTANGEKLGAYEPPLTKKEKKRILQQIKREKNT